MVTNQRLHASWRFVCSSSIYPSIQGIIVRAVGCYWGTGLGQTGYMVPFLPLYTLCSILSYFIPLLFSALIWASASCLVTWDRCFCNVVIAMLKTAIKYGLASAPDMVDICPGCKSCRHDHFIWMNLRHNILAVPHRSPQPISAISATAEKKPGKVDRKNMTSCCAVPRHCSLQCTAVVWSADVCIPLLLELFHSPFAPAELDYVG